MRIIIRTVSSAAILTKKKITSILLEKSIIFSRYRIPISIKSPSVLAFTILASSSRLPCTLFGVYRLNAEYRIRYIGTMSSSAVM